MNTETQKRHPISSLFTRFIVGFGSGFVGTLSLGLILFLSWHILGDSIQGTNEIKDALGSSIGTLETHTLSVILIMMAVFISSLLTTLTYAFLSILVEEQYTKKTTTLTHTFYGNVIFLILFFPLYLIVNKYFQTNGIIYIAGIHALLTCFFSLFILQTLHKGEYVLVNLYGNILGIILFLALGTLLFSSSQGIIMALLSYPLFMSSLSLSNRSVEFFYVFLYEKTGSDMLNIETTFGDDYGVAPTPKSFNEDEEFDKLFKL